MQQNCLCKDKVFALMLGFDVDIYDATASHATMFIGNTERNSWFVCFLCSLVFQLGLSAVADMNGTGLNVTCPSEAERGIQVVVTLLIFLVRNSLQETSRVILVNQAAGLVTVLYNTDQQSLQACFRMMKTALTWFFIWDLS